MYSLLFTVVWALRGIVISNARCPALLHVFSKADFNVVGSWLPPPSYGGRAVCTSFLEEMESGRDL